MTAHLQFKMKAGDRLHLTAYAYKGVGKHHAKVLFSSLRVHLSHFLTHMYSHPFSHTPLHVHTHAHSGLLSRPWLIGWSRIFSSTQRKSIS